MIGRLLRRNLSKVQLIGFILSNFIGLAIVISGIQFYSDIKSIWENDTSFINQDYLMINKKVTKNHLPGSDDTDFTPEEIEEIKSQPWVRSIGNFTSADYEVEAKIELGGRRISTKMFLEAIPDDFIDINPEDWKFKEGDSRVPMIISRDYLTLFNFGFATASGLPQISENTLSSVPLTLILESRKGKKELDFDARIVGYSGRLNTILVPQSFMEWSNDTLGSKEETKAPRRLIIDVSSPGDVAIDRYLDEKGYERAGEDKGSQAAYFVKIVAGLIIGIGALITFLSFFILLLSVALLMQKNRAKLHLLIMLGYDLRHVGRPYEVITTVVSIVSYALAVAAMIVFRNLYISGIEDLTGTDKVGVAVALLCGAALVVFTLIVNIIAIRRKVKSAFYA